MLPGPRTAPRQHGRQPKRRCHQFSSSLPSLCRRLSRLKEAPVAMRTAAAGPLQLVSFRSSRSCPLLPVSGVQQQGVVGRIHAGDDGSTPGYGGSGVLSARSALWVVSSFGARNEPRRRPQEGRLWFWAAAARIRACAWLSLGLVPLRWQQRAASAMGSEAGVGFRDGGQHQLW